MLIAIESKVFALATDKDGALPDCLLASISLGLGSEVGRKTLSFRRFGQHMGACQIGISSLDRE